jgi:hypothetical protein
MLFKLGSSGGKPSTLEAVPFNDFQGTGQLDKDLEDLIASSLFEVLFEDAPLMPVFQERARQAEADIYALDRAGEPVIFELKRGQAGADAMQQALRYAQAAGQWTFAELQRRYQLHAGTAAGLAAAHAEAFQLERPLDERQFNRRQRLMIIGSAADDGLIDAVDYWKRQGIQIEFLPYRLYQLGGTTLLEFFAPPYDGRSNPAAARAYCSTPTASGTRTPSGT